MDKELALAIDFNKAPAELKAAAKAYYDDLKLVNKAIKAISVETEKLELARKKSEESAKTFRIALKAWEPEV